MVRDFRLEELFHASKLIAAECDELAPGSAARQSNEVATNTCIHLRSFGCGCAALQKVLLAFNPEPTSTTSTQLDMSAHFNESGTALRPSGRSQESRFLHENKSIVCWDVCWAGSGLRS